MNGVLERQSTIAWLRSAQAVRIRCHQVLHFAEEDRLGWFDVHLDALDRVTEYVARVTRETYPTLDIPYHSRWRHFSAGGIDRWSRLAGELHGLDSREIARIRFDLCIISVLLDAGAGPIWCYREPATGLELTRSEGLAAASLAAFRTGLFSSERRHPLQVDAERLVALDRKDLALVFQVDEQNPLVGIEGRMALLHRLGHALAARPDLFGSQARPSGLYDHLERQSSTRRLCAQDVLAAVLDGLSSIWPGRIELAGQNLGDVWHYPKLGSGGIGGDLLPFHKLSQWLTYSLIEVLDDSGITVTEIEALTGLPEYRNGGLFIDLGVLSLRDSLLAEQELPVDHEAIVEWRALTVALLDILAERVRKTLGKSPAQMPLARILQGGTWQAGRRIAAERRADGAPPLKVLSDGTVF